MQEIERKFLVKELPDLLKFTPHEIEQTYLTLNPELRLRKYDDKYFLTVKTEGDLQRREWEIPILKDTYLYMLKFATTKTLRKTRYTYQNFELDIYHNLDLIIVEVEFSTVEEAESFVVPSWFGKEVTYDKEFKNKNLAKILEGNSMSKVG